MFYKIGVLKNFVELPRKHLCCIKKITPAQVFSWDVYEIFKNSQHITDDISSFLALTFSAFIALLFLKMISRITIL